MDHYQERLRTTKRQLLSKKEIYKRIDWNLRVLNDCDHSDILETRTSKPAQRGKLQERHRPA
jgi:hypothetical protein